MLDDKAQVHLSLGAIAIVIAMFFRVVMGERTRFRVFYLIGHMMLASGLVSLNVWVGIAMLASWFLVAIFFYIQERKERTKV